MAKTKDRLTASGLPKDENDWTVEDWRELFDGIEQIKTRIAARHGKADHQNRALRHLGVSSGEWMDVLAEILEREAVKCRESSEKAHTPYGEAFIAVEAAFKELARVLRGEKAGTSIGELTHGAR